MATYVITATDGTVFRVKASNEYEAIEKIDSTKYEVFLVKKAGRGRPNKGTVTL